MLVQQEVVEWSDGECNLVTNEADFHSVRVFVFMTHVLGNINLFTVTLCGPSSLVCKSTMSVCACMSVMEKKPRKDPPPNHQRN